MEAICILEDALPIDLADLPVELLESVASRPFMIKLERGRDGERADQMASLRGIYPDYYAPRHGVFRDRYNHEADKAAMGLFLKRRKVKRND